MWATKHTPTSKPLSPYNMSAPQIALIAAMDQNRVIGAKGNHALLWHIPEDLAHFKAVTQGAPVIMGRHTHISIGRLLPKRVNIVISSQPDYTPLTGAIKVASWDEALAECQRFDPDWVYVIGGASLYAQTLQYATRVYLTVIDKAFNGDALFPDLGPAWALSHEHTGKDCDNLGLNYRFQTWDRNA